ncbi:hypothetical protein LTR36_008579 [Oleoguttula mirabilis]|uniref:Chitin-binding type-1 domain-containing protein n=1 Tax=Oleoguttula mirabilis TaxID=1507867 RepID=A0AAV9JT12_9PEZI|nr:hypothetical protein LTR36_008579 [Oleoguttula mirabilis]
MHRPVLKCFGGFCTITIVYILLSGVGARLVGLGPPAAILENTQWVSSSKYWLDRQACNWFLTCGAMHLNSNGWTWEQARDDIPNELPDLAPFWTSGEEDPDMWSEEERQVREIPQYVFDHAPYVHLFSGEEFWPSDLAEHLVHVSPRLNYTFIDDMEYDRNLTNLHELDDIREGMHGRFVYLQSDDNVEERPKWLTSNHNIPKSPDPTLDIELDAQWPDMDVQDDISLPGYDQQLPTNQELASSIGIPFPTSPADLTPSTNGRCGGNSGFTCAKSNFGKCCSIHGWCGKSDEYCNSYCDPLHGTCTDPLNPPQGPKPDLRKHKRDFLHRQDRPSRLGRSKAPAILIVADKGNGTVDAFWFYFYSFNLGQKVMNVRFGNHVGDWEHTLIRFQHGKPESVFLSEHNFGDAYTWHAMEKYVPNPDGSQTMVGTWSNETFDKVAKRPVTYSALGSHAMYATPGLHPYILPWGLLHDQTDRGPLWDPVQNVQSYTYEITNKTVRASTRNPRSPTGWLDFAGHWGDKYYPLSDPRQYRLAGQYHYVNGPTGPKFKRLGREAVCQGRRPCRVRNWLGGNRPQRLIPADGDGDEVGGLPGGNSTDDSP